MKKAFKHCCLKASIERYLAESNCSTRFCRPLPNRSAKVPFRNCECKGNAFILSRKTFRTKFIINPFLMPVLSIFLLAFHHCTVAIMTVFRPFSALSGKGTTVAVARASRTPCATKLPPYHVSGINDSHGKHCKHYYILYHPFRSYISFTIIKISPCKVKRKSAIRQQHTAITAAHAYSPKPNKPFDSTKQAVCLEQTSHLIRANKPFTSTNQHWSATRIINRQTSIPSGSEHQAQLPGVFVLFVHSNPPIAYLDIRNIFITLH